MFSFRQVSHRSCNCGLVLPLGLLLLLSGEYEECLFNGFLLVCGLREADRIGVWRLTLSVLPLDCDLFLALGLVAAAALPRLGTRGVDERGESLVAFTRAIAVFSSATIRLWTLSSNSLLGTSVISLYFDDAIKSLCILAS